MFGKIVYLANNVAHIEIPEGTPLNENLMNKIKNGLRS